MCPVTWLSEPRPAKVNLYLHVTGRRADGYHLLDSLVVFAGVGDVLRAAPAETLSLTRRRGRSPRTWPSEPDNLVLRAARALGGRGGVTPARVWCWRRTCRWRRASAAVRPMRPRRCGCCAGCGGIAPDPRRCWPGSRPALGADVPVCLASRASRMGGVGELLAPAPGIAGMWHGAGQPRRGASRPPMYSGRATAPGRLPARSCRRAWPDAAAMAADPAPTAQRSANRRRSRLQPVIGEVLQRWRRRRAACWRA